MKKFTRLCFVMSVGMMMSSCTLTIHEDDFYKVEFYSDYIGIEEDYANKALDETEATLLGHAYAKRPKQNKVSEESGTSAEPTYTYFGVDEPTKLEAGITDYRKSTRVAPEGYEWKFDKWVGFYDNGDEIDITQIKGDCSVFALFKSVPINYSVSIEGLSSDNIYYRCNYGDKLKDNEEYQLSPLTSDPLAYYADPYYRTSTLKRLKYVIDDVDHSDEVTAPYYSFIENAPIKGNTKFIYEYNDPVKHVYTVRCRAISEEDSSVISDWAEQQVIYDDPIVKPVPDDSLEWAFVKSIGTYGEDARADNPVLNSIDVECIRHNCEVTLVYRKKAISCTAHIYDENGTNLIEDKPAYVGAPAILSAPTIVNASKTWTGIYAIKETGEIFDTSTIMTEDINLVPVAVDKEATKNFTVHDATTDTDISLQAHYTFNRGYGGYCIDRITDPNEPAKIVEDSHISLSAENIAYSTTDNFIHKKFATVAIQSFGTSSIVQTIYDITLPNTITHLLGVSFRGMTNLQVIDLRANDKLISIGDFAFDRLSSIDHIYLPSSILYMGYRIVNDCSNLITLPQHLHINMTEAAVQAKIDAGDISSEWNAIMTDRMNVTHFAEVDYAG